MAEVPTGTFAFLFTDIEGSTQLWELHPDLMGEALARHDAILRAAIEANCGIVFKTVGDAFCAAFSSVPLAVSAALSAQQRLAVGNLGLPIRVRMALHAGTAQLRDEDYFGPTLNRTARLMAAGYGGQILVSEDARDLCLDSLPPSSSLTSLGEHRLRDLNQPLVVYQLLHPDLPGSFPHLRSLGNPQLPNNLPLEVTSFIGREKEIGEIRALLSRERLVTLVGAGGSGKTRAALHAAAEMLADSPDGVWLVELAPLSDPSLVVQAVASVLSVREERANRLADTVAAGLKAKRLVIVLDNCEHVLDASARLAELLIRSCPQVQILATSREALNIPGEVAYRIPSLSLPEKREMTSPEALIRYEAIRLFVDRAGAASHGFRLTEKNSAAVAELCLRLDGIPLALELAAARTRVMTVEQIAARLDDRFRLLTGGSRTALPRQQTLRALIDWSYDLLSEPERIVLRRLSVFLGGCTLEAAEEVCAGGGVDQREILDILARLVDKSLILFESRDHAYGRYGLLETIRQYARDRLLESSESELIRDSHLSFYLRLAERPIGAMAEQNAGWFNCLEAEHDNFRSSLEWCTVHGESSARSGQLVESGLRLAGALHGFLAHRGHGREAQEWLERMLAQDTQALPTVGRARSLSGLARARTYAGYSPELRPAIDECIGIYRTLNDEIGLVHALGNLLRFINQSGEAAPAELLDEILSISHRVGSPGLLCNILNDIGWYLANRGEVDRAQSVLEESLVVGRKAGDKLGMGYALFRLVDVFLKRDDLVSARRTATESLDLLRESRNTVGVTWLLAHLGHMDLEQGDHGNAAARLQESFATALRLGIPDLLGHALAGLLLSLSEGDYEHLILLGQDHPAIRRALEHQAAAFQAFGSLAHRARKEGDYAWAARFYLEALNRQVATGGAFKTAQVLEDIGCIAADRKDSLRAAIIFGAAASACRSLRVTPPVAMVAEYEAAVSGIREHLGEDAFQKSWAEGLEMTADRAVRLAAEVMRELFPR